VRNELGAGVVALGLATSANAAETPAPDRLAPVQKVDVGRGDEWVYETRDSLTGNALSEVDVVVVEASAGKIDVRLRVTSPTSGMVRVAAATFDEFWRKLPDASSPGAGAQDSWGVKPNLKAGDSWNYSYDRPLFAGPASMRWIGHGEALGAEAVDLPGGQTEQTLKIEFFERPSVARYNLELHVVEWFAPDMNRYVRRDVETRWNGQVTESTTDELQDYIRRR
jgi:hypothetical protein